MYSELYECLILNDVALYQVVYPALSLKVRNVTSAYSVEHVAEVSANTPPVLSAPGGDKLQYAAEKCRHGVHANWMSWPFGHN